jgi:hypothetical protein
VCVAPAKRTALVREIVLFPLNVMMPSSMYIAPP